MPEEAPANFDEGASAVNEAVNSDSGFLAALAAKVGKEVPEGADTSMGADISAGLTFGEEPEQHEPQKVEAPVVAQETSAATDDSKETLLHEDPEIADYLKRYDGDPDKALKAAANLVPRFGEQGQELGETRKQLNEAQQQIAELRGRMDAMSAQPRQAPQPVTSADVDNIEQMVAEHGGAQVTMWTIQNRPDLYDHALAAWAEQSPKDTLAASRFDRTFQAELAKANEQIAAERRAAQVDPDREFIANQRLTAETNDLLEAKAEATPDWSEIAPYMTEALEHVPTIIARGVLGQSNEVTREEAVDQVMIVARQLHLDKLKEELAAGAKKEVPQVITSTARPAATQQQKPLSEMTEEERIATFKKSILAREDTSVASGLTFAK